jgi:hypothetical protein
LAVLPRCRSPRSPLAAFDFFRSEYSATKAELQAALAQRFPLRQRYAELFTVTLRNPQLGLDPENNRLSVTALLAITSPLLQPPGVGGLVSVSSALRYDAPARTLRLDQPRADRIEIEGLSGRDGERLQQIGAVVAQELMQGQALHTFEAKDLTVGNKVYEIGDHPAARRNQGTDQVRPALIFATQRLPGHQRLRSEAV